MTTKTPQFDTAIAKILETLTPHTRECRWAGQHQYCERNLEITSEDIEFLRMLKVPAPNFCPTCRRIRRMTHMNLSRLSKRPCNAPGHTESMISILPLECPFPVYDFEYFISDEFDPFIFGKIYNDAESPLNTLLDMRRGFPMPSFLNRDPSCINSDYSNGGRDLKNGYYVFGCYVCEDIWYSGLIQKCKDIMDSRVIRKSDHVYSSMFSDHIYKSSFIYFSKDSTNSMFLFDCRNCDSCFGCVNLRNAKYCVWNKQLSKEDYDAFIKSIYPLTIDGLAEYQKEFWKLVKSLPFNASRNNSAVNSDGVILWNTKNLYDVTDSQNSEHARHSDGLLNHQDSMDVLYSGGFSSLLYGTTNIGSQSSNVKFSVSSKNCTDSEFIFNSKNLSNCFMCFGLQNKTHCVLNVQYSPEEYFALVDKMKVKMLETGEYGDVLGMEFSAQAYNFSVGQIMFPLGNVEIENLGGYVAQEPETNAGSMKILSRSEIPQTIDAVGENILTSAIKCEITGRPFRITASELEFYRRMKLPLPTRHPIVRIQEKLAMIPIGKKHPADCAKCGKAIYSVFDPKDGYLLYCAECYQQEVY